MLSPTMQQVFSEFASDVRAGLIKPQQRELPSKYLYDDSRFLGGRGLTTRNVSDPSYNSGNRFRQNPPKRIRRTIRSGGRFGLHLAVGAMPPPATDTARVGVGRRRLSRDEEPVG